MIVIVSHSILAYINIWMIFSELEILDQCDLKVGKVQVCTRRPPIGAPATPEVDQDYYHYPQLGS